MVNMSSVGANSLLAFTIHTYTTNDTETITSALAGVSFCYDWQPSFQSILRGFPYQCGVIDSNACHDSTSPIRLALQQLGGISRFSPTTPVVVVVGNDRAALGGRFIH